MSALPRPPRRMAPAGRGAVAVLAALALTLSGCARLTDGVGALATSGGPVSTPRTGTPTTPEPDTLPAPAVSFGSCTAIFDPGRLGLPSARAGQLQFECATLTVPLDYAQPAGRQITLSLVRVHSRTNPGHRPLLVNPGGPGGSGFQLALGLAGQVDQAVLDHYDIVGFDPRGVGLSSPLHCVDDTVKDQLNAASPDVTTAAGFAEAKQLAAQLATACTSAYGAALAQYNTTNTARDMNQIRKALAAAQLDYLGFSYGTELGAAYAHLFPGTVGAMVLDGAVDPLTDDITSFATQLDGFERAFDQFAADCATRPTCARLGNLRTLVTSIVTAARAAPLSTGTARKLTAALALTGVLDALYSAEDWPTLATALADAQHGDGAGLLSLADSYNQRYSGRYSNILEANTAISCNDAPPGPSDEVIRATAQSWSQRFPMFGLWAAASLFGCQQWQPERSLLPHPSAATPAPVLVVGNLNDPATPYQGAIDLAKTMGNAMLLSWDGAGHTSYLQGSGCVDGYVNAYLVAGTLPPAQTVCPR